MERIKLQTAPLYFWHRRKICQQILVNNQFDALFSMYLFISHPYMFQATQCSSSGELNCINTSSGICHSV